MLLSMKLKKLFLIRDNELLTGKIKLKHVIEYQDIWNVYIIKVVSFDMNPMFLEVTLNSFMIILGIFISF